MVTPATLMIPEDVLAIEQSRSPYGRRKREQSLTRGISAASGGTWRSANSIPALWMSDESARVYNQGVGYKILSLPVPVDVWISGCCKRVFSVFPCDAESQTCKAVMRRPDGKIKPGQTVRR